MKTIVFKSCDRQVHYGTSDWANHYLQDSLGGRQLWSGICGIPTRNDSGVCDRCLFENVEDYYPGEVRAMLRIVDSDGNESLV